VGVVIILSLFRVFRLFDSITSDAAEEQSECQNAAPAQDRAQVTLKSTFAILRLVRGDA
jgi:hypothetical protein